MKNYIYCSAMNYHGQKSNLWRMCTNDLDGMIKLSNLSTKEKPKNQGWEHSQNLGCLSLAPLLWYCLHHGALQLCFTKVTSLVLLCDNIPNNFGMWPYKEISHPFSPLLSYDPIHKTKQGLKIGGKLLVANHLDQSLWLTHYKQGASARSYLLHFFWQVHTFIMPFTNLKKLCKNAVPKPFCWAKPHVLTFFYLVLMCKVTY